jgi:signal transduction histidine kinase/CheY-like chemotaxis protein
MKPRLGSIDLKFPMVMSGLILVTAGFFVWAAYAQFSRAMLEASGERLRSGARGVAPLVGGPDADRRARTAAIVGDPAVRDLLRGGRREAQVDSLLASALAEPSDGIRAGMQLVDARGTVRIERRVRELSVWPTWAQDRIRAGTAPGAQTEYSPFMRADAEPVFQYMTPVVGVADEPARDTVLGYLVETRVATGRGQEALRQLVGAGVFLVGVPGDSVWTDLETTYPAPLAIPRPDTVLVFARSTSGPGVGAAQVVDGTPWVVWLQQPRGDVVAPLKAFIWRIAPVTAAIALLAALVVWLLSRQITNRLVALTDEVDRMETGQGQPPPPVHEPDDEIERLEQAFDRMAARVEQQQALEQQLMQSQKIEAVGRLAGGIAHDFNNMLTVVRNYSELVRAELPKGTEVRGDIDEVLRATERAAALTRQLLAFSRQQVVAPQELDVNEVILGSQRMLQRVIPSHVVFETELDPGLPRITADRGQIEQVLLNLTINAADAMPEGGTITIRSDLAAPAATEGGDAVAVARGPFVRISVRDSGIGMDRETRERVFEPFFSTKPVGKGTGLGLPTVHGIVSQSGGHIRIDSEPGAGTTVMLYFPPLVGPAGAPTAGGTDVAGEMPGSGTTIPDDTASYAAPAAVVIPRGTILVVEDDAATRDVTRRLLQRHGFRILEAEHGGAALVALGSGHIPVDLVLTDVMMPGMSGVDLAARIGDRWPDLPVLLMSGYSDAEIRAKGPLGRQRSLIEKPFTASGLLRAVEAALADAATRTAPAR